MKKRLLLLLCLLVTAGSVARAQIGQGAIGNGTWMVDENGKLTVSVNGNMKDYGEGKAPWYGYRNRIKSIHIGPNCKNVGRNCFFGLMGVRTVTGGENVESVAMYAFESCGGWDLAEDKRIEPIPSIYFPKCDYVGECAFADCSVKAISLPKVEKWKVAAITGGRDTYGITDGFNKGSGLNSCDFLDLGSKTKMLRPGSLMGPYYVFCQNPTPPSWERLYDKDEGPLAIRVVSDVVAGALSWGLGTAVLELVWNLIGYDKGNREYEYPFGDNPDVKVIVPLEYLQTYKDYYPSEHPEVSSGYMCAYYTNSDDHSKKGKTSSTGKLCAGAPIYQNGKLIGGWYVEDSELHVALNLDEMPAWTADNAPWKSVLGSVTRMYIEASGDEFKIPNDCFSGGKAISKVKYLRIAAIDGIGSVVIGDRAFKNCPDLESFENDDYSSSRQNLKPLKIGKEAFSGSTKFFTLHRFDVTELGESAFYGCTKFSNNSGYTTFSIKDIPAHAFEGCTCLDKYDFSWVRTTGKRAFANSGLDDVNLSNATSVGEEAFAGSGLNKIVFGPSTQGASVFGSKCFAGCTYLGNIDVSSVLASVSGITSSTFEGVTLSNITLNVGPRLYGDYYENDPVFGKMKVNKLFDWPVGSPGDGWEIIRGRNEEDGVLRIYRRFGSDYTSELNQPWHNYREYVKTVDVDYGIDYIGKYEFADLPNVVSVRLPYGIKRIQDCAFKDCPKLKDIRITGIEELGNNVFEGCSSLEYIDLGTGLKKAGDYIFKNCTSLALIDNKDNTPAEVSGLTFASIGSQAYQRRGGRPMKAIGQDAVTLNVPDEFVTNYIIDRNWGKFHIAFTDSRGTWRHAGRFGDGTWILYDDGTMVVSADKGPGEDWFDNDHQTLGFTKEVRENTKTIEISGNISALYNCFTDFDNLESVQLGEKVRKLDGTFYNCQKLREINVNNVDTIIDAFARAQLPMLDLSNVKVLGRYAMYATDITVAKLGKQCDVAKYAFYGCDKLTAIDVGGANFDKAEGCFKGCSSLKYVALNCKKISEQMFSGCSSLTAIKIGANTETIYDEFEGCTSLDTIYCDNPTPPALPVYDKVVYLNDVNWEYVDARAFDALTLSNIKLIVKREYIPLYRKTEVWKEMQIVADDADDAEPLLPTGGSIGQGGTWTIDANGVLTIDYDGNFYSTNGEGVKWHDLFAPYLAYITKVVATDNVKQLPADMVGEHNTLLSEDMKTVELGTRMRTLCNGSLNYKGLTDVYCYAVTCPTVESTAFDWDAIAENNATLHVVNMPGLPDCYRNSKTWGKFPNIVADLESRLPANVFRSATVEGLNIWYRITDADAKTVETYPRDFLDGGSAVECNAYTQYDKLTIPATVTYNGTTYRVTGIGDNSFYGCTNFADFSLPEGLENIGSYAFYSTNGMHISDFTLPSSVKFIGECAFEMWTGLQRLTVLGQEPPVTDDNAINTYWDPYMAPHPILLVPGGTRDAWNVAPWNNWFTIIDKENPNTLTYKVKPGANFWDNRNNDEEYMCIEALMQVGELTYENELVDKVWNPDGFFWDEIWADVYYNKAHKKLFYLEDGQYIKIFDGVSPADNIYYEFKASDYDQMVYTAGENVRLFKAATIIFPENAVQSDVYFSAVNEDGIEISYRVIDEQKKTCEVKPDPSGYNTYAVAYGTQNLKIPYEANGYVVLGIAADAFSGMTDLEEVTLPSSLRNLGQSAFSYCENLHNVYIYRTNPPMLLDADGFLAEGQNAAFENVGMPAGSDMGWATLHVPEGCTEAYDLEPWTIWFPTIQDDVIDNPDGIKKIKDSKDVKNSWFDLSGRKLGSKPAKAGMYILNGKKVVIK